uniref:Survival Motor Neuron Gemin2-binding domain-containing protein n=1 Tax=Solanum tuberosum TaxID=4113 RepID=M0ZWS5_SOLTU
MGENDLWDDSALVNAFNDAVSKYKVLPSLYNLSKLTLTSLLLVMSAVFSIFAFNAVLLNSSNISRAKEGKRASSRTQNGPWTIHDTLDGPFRGTRPALGIVNDRPRLHRQESWASSRTQNGPWTIHDTLDGPFRGTRPALGFVNDRPRLHRQESPRRDPRRFVVTCTIQVFGTINKCSIEITSHFLIAFGETS